MLDHIIILIFHYGYDAIVEFVVEVGDHLISHYVVIIVVKAGVVHGVYLLVKTHLHHKR